VWNIRYEVKDFKEGWRSTYKVREGTQIGTNDSQAVWIKIILMKFLGTSLPELNEF
jgi:hypothetical protein